MEWKIKISEIELRAFNFNFFSKDGVRCFVEGLANSLVLNLTGSCIQIVPQKETYSFETFVRSKESKNITISNRTNSTWQLRPIVEGDYFQGLESFTVEAQSTSSYEVVYHPLTMTTTSAVAVTSDNKQKHTGSVFFPLPDGTGLMFNLIGVANPPKPIARIQRDVPCKTNHVEVLSVENWLKKPQRFKVNTFISPARGFPINSFKLEFDLTKTNKANFLTH